ncbi:membrane protein insertion efficiency factor YidD [Caminibacter sp.]
MILKKFAIKFVKFYKYFISPALGSNCRYYPTCSCYALWEFENENFFKAFIKSVLRILKCNQLFRGGIDYPVISKKINPCYGKKIEIKYWLIPKNDKFIVIKAENERTR